MPRGIIPRQPSRSGRHDKVSTKPVRAKVTAMRAAPVLRTVAKGAVLPIVASRAAPKKLAGQTAIQGYSPLAPQRVNEILKRLDERYPLATCALHHKSAWELLVATILSAQCTDVR